MSEIPTAAESEVSQEFYDAVLAWNREHSSAHNSAFLEKLDRYHLGCNRRGRRYVDGVAARLAPYGVSVAGSRFLDIGCGMGGAAYGAASLGAAWCEGWEVNQVKLQLGQLNVETLPRPEFRSRLHLIERDVTEPFAGVPFHVVLCQEVLEHVKDPARAARGLAASLDPERGVAYISVPNGFSLKSVLKDPHLMLFGICLLDLGHAAKVAAAVLNHQNYGHMMGFYLSMSEHARLFEEAGLVWAAAHRRVPGETADVRALVAEIEAGRRTYLPAWRDRVPDDVLSELDRRVDRYLADVELALRGGTSTSIDEYMTDTFEFIVTGARSRIAGAVRG